ncbi:MAG: TrgA family protein [Pseudomonadota bacterium]
MPTGARLMTSLLMGLAMVGAVYLAAFHDPSLITTRERMFGLAGAIGAFFGWSVLGRRLGDGFGRSAGWAMTTLALSCFWMFAILAMRYSYNGMMAGLYRGQPMQALEATVQQFFIYAAYGADLRVIVAGVVGALIAGAMGEYARMIWN